MEQLKESLKKTEDFKYKLVNDWVNQIDLDDILEAEKWIKHFLTTHTISILQGEIERAEEEIEFIQKHSRGNYADGMIQANKRLITHLEEEIK